MYKSSPLWSALSIVPSSTVHVTRFPQPVDHTQKSADSSSFRVVRHYPDLYVILEHSNLHFSLLITNLAATLTSATSGSPTVSDALHTFLSLQRYRLDRRSLKIHRLGRRASANLWNDISALASPNDIFLNRQWPDQASEKTVYFLLDFYRGIWKFAWDLLFSKSSHTASDLCAPDLIQNRLDE